MHRDRGSNQSAHHRVHCVIGTRPEAIKLAPVVHALKAHPNFLVDVYCTGQHRELVQDLLGVLGLEPAANFDLMVENQGAARSVSASMERLAEHWRRQPPDLVLVQGDTGSAVGAAMAAHYGRVPVGHVEAGLRTFDPERPFPEETNRVLISRVARWHFCPTEKNRNNLLREGIDRQQTFVTGQTGVDTFLRLWRQNGAVDTSAPAPWLSLSERLLVTAHRRENAGRGFDEICRGLRKLARSRPKAGVLFPVHPNPAIRTAVERHLEGLDNVWLVDPMRYDHFVAAIRAATVIVTDSGGIQEEACTVGKPTLVLRDKTERQEGLAHGSVKTIGASAERLVREVSALLESPIAMAQLSRPTACFGDGAAGRRIVQVLLHLLAGGSRPLDYAPFEPAAAALVPDRSRPTTAAAVRSVTHD